MITTTVLLRRSALAVASAVALALPIAHAASTIEVDPSGIDFASQVAAAGIDLAWDRGLVLTLVAADTTSIGNLALPGYAAGALATDALGRILADEAATRLGFTTTYPGGVAFVQQGTNVEAVMRAYAERFVELGFVVDRPAGASTLTIHREGRSFRAVFGVVESGVMVYLGG